MRILVTRPEPDASRMAKQLQALGHETTIEPLMHVSFDDPDPVEIADAQALIATSRNALLAVALQPQLLAIAKALPIYAVGRATANTARDLGFGLIIAGAGTAADLIPQITATVDPAAGPLVHLAGDQLAVDMSAELRELGFQIDSPVLYRMRASNRFSEDTFEQFAMGEIEAVMLLSPRTASIYSDIVKKQGLLSVARRMTHYCLSAAVAQRLNTLGTIRTEVAALPNLEEVLALVA